MSYGVALKVDGKFVQVERHVEGGVFAAGGTHQADLYVTFNYSPFFREHIDSEQRLYWLHGKTGAACIARLESAVAALGTERDPDYWKATAGNAGYALSILLKWAKEHPEAVFDVEM